MFNFKCLRKRNIAVIGFTADGDVFGAEKKEEPESNSSFCEVVPVVKARRHRDERRHQEGRCAQLDAFLLCCMAQALLANQRAVEKLL